MIAEPAPAAPLLGEKVHRDMAEVAWEVLAGRFEDTSTTYLSETAEAILTALEPYIAAPVAEQVRLARIDERLRCAAACDRLGAPDVASIIRDSAA